MKKSILNLRTAESNDTKRLAERIEELVRSHDYVSFAELNRRMPETKGNLALTAADYPNIIWWPFCSRELVDALKELRGKGKIHSHASVLLVYLIDGIVPSMKIAKRSIQYKTERWLPIVFRPGPSCADRGCPFRSSRRLPTGEQEKKP